MWFKVLSILIMLLCLGKAGAALFAPNVFYRIRRQQYASPTIPVSVFLPPLAIGLLTTAAWYATFLHYTAWGWVVTAFLTLISLLAVANLLRWSHHRITLLGSIADEQAVYRRKVDVGLMGIGALFGFLAVIAF